MVLVLYVCVKFSVFVLWLALLQSQKLGPKLLSQRALRAPECQGFWKLGSLKAFCYQQADFETLPPEQRNMIIGRDAQRLGNLNGLV